VRVRILLSVAALLAVYLGARLAGPSAAPLPVAHPQPSAGAAGGETGASSPAEAETSRPLRDLFRYADEPSPEAARRPVIREPQAPRATPTVMAPPPVRLIGLVRQPGGLRVAIAVLGEIVLLRPGESAGGYTLVALDDSGVRLRGPDGQEERLDFPE
jgi:hypothetical protein